MDIPLDSMPVVYETVVASQHLDRFGHVNVMWFTHFFDEATLSLFERLGCGPSYYARTRYGMFALQQHTRYLRELRQGDPIELRPRVLGLSPKRIHFMLFLAGGRPSGLSATCELLGMHVDLPARRSAPFPDAVLIAITELFETHRSLPWSAPVCGAIRA